jgi:sugar (pentulose or hexulose) kinase
MPRGYKKDGTPLGYRGGKIKPQQVRVTGHDGKIIPVDENGKPIEKPIEVKKTVEDIVKVRDVKEIDDTIDDVSELIIKGSIFCKNCQIEICKKDENEISPAKKMNVMTQGGYVLVMCTCGKITKVAKDHPGLSIMQPGFRRIY